LAEAREQEAIHEQTADELEEARRQVRRLQVELGDVKLELADAQAELTDDGYSEDAEAAVANLAAEYSIVLLLSLLLLLSFRSHAHTRLDMNDDWPRWKLKINVSRPNSTLNKRHTKPSSKVSPKLLPRRPR
jgi:hypothetical protein